MPPATNPPPREWRDEFVLARDARNVGAKAALLRDVRSGLLVPVYRGVYREAQYFAAGAAELTRPVGSARALGPVRAESATGRNAADDRYLAVVRASQLVSARPLVYSHLSAAALWGLPVIGSWPLGVHVTARREGGGRSTAGLVRHGTDLDFEVADIDGLRATSLARTVVDVARTASFETAVAVADAALAGLRDSNKRWIRHPIDRAELLQIAAALGSARGMAQGRMVITFAEGASGSAGESLSRVGFLLLGFPPPILQQRFDDHLGSMWTDFWWPEFNLIGEFDGFGKYLREEFLHGRTAAQAVIDEKIREDRLRAFGPRVTRWNWATAKSLPALRAHLLAAGLRPISRHAA